MTDTRCSPERHVADMYAAAGFSKPVQRAFVKCIMDHYRAHKREMPWRDNPEPYHVLVSEMMLQQTQVDRVRSSYDMFIKRFATVESLARASFEDVISCWQGLGYNRRAVWIASIARTVVSDYGGVIPDDPAVLESFKGIGRNTAASIAAFAFNKPVVFIETNIRTVYIYFFFQGKTGIEDKDILPLVERTLDVSSPREWYYALMDYGVMLKKREKNPSRTSAHYKKQSPFKGSSRELRGSILKQLIARSGQLASELAAAVGSETDITASLSVLCRDGLIAEENGRYRIR